MQNVKQLYAIDFFDDRFIIPLFIAPCFNIALLAAAYLILKANGESKAIDNLMRTRRPALKLAVVALITSFVFDPILWSGYVNHLAGYLKERAEETEVVTGEYRLLDVVGSTKKVQIGGTRLQFSASGGGYCYAGKPDILEETNGKGVFELHFVTFLFQPNACITKIIHFDKVNMSN